MERFEGDSICPLGLTFDAGRRARYMVDEGLGITDAQWLRWRICWRRKQTLQAGVCRFPAIIPWEQPREEGWGRGADRFIGGGSIDVTMEDSVARRGVAGFVSVSLDFAVPETDASKAW